MRFCAADTIRFIYSRLPYKEKAWEDLIRITEDEDIDPRFDTGDLLGSVFSYVPDKVKAWNDLIRLTIKGDIDVRSETAFLFSWLSFCLCA